MYTYISVEHTIRHEIAKNVLIFYKKVFANSYIIYRLLRYIDFKSIEILCLDFIYGTFSIIFFKSKQNYEVTCYCIVRRDTRNLIANYIIMHMTIYSVTYNTLNIHI